MLPLRDTVPSRSRPWINYLLLLANIGIFVWLIGQSATEQGRLVERYAVVPSRLLGHPGLPEWMTLITSMFLHGGWLHLGGNMLVLFIFGDNVEDRLGHLRYLGFYLVCGIIAGLTQVAVAATSNVPGIGASGAIAGVLAAYLLWYPGARVVTLVPIWILPWLVVLPAFVVIGLWFVLQALEGVLALDQGLAGSGGVAWWAHIGGFIAGLVLGPMLALGRPRTY